MEPDSGFLIANKLTVGTVTVNGGRFVKIEALSRANEADNTIIQAGVGESVLGVAIGGGLTGASSGVGTLGKCTVPIVQDPNAAIGGFPVKATLDGKAQRFIDAAFASSTIATTAAGGNYANQPANDSVTLVSSNAGDTQNAIITGTTFGGLVVVQETIALNGVGAVTTTKVDWGVILGIQLASAAVGTITISETSGGLAITTIAPAAVSSGYTLVTPATSYAGDATVAFVSGGATTKYIGIEGVNTAGATVRECVQLNGATAVNSIGLYQYLTKFWWGDVETARAATARVNATVNAESLRAGWCYRNGAGTVLHIILGR